MTLIDRPAARSAAAALFVLALFVLAPAQPGSAQSSAQSSAQVPAPAPKPPGTALQSPPGPTHSELRFGAEGATLANGLTVVVVPMPLAPAVVHMVYYRAGSIDEPQGKSGIAHFLEHMMFKGTPDVPDAQFSRLISRAGGRDNAFTTYDYTAYHQTIPAEQLRFVMGLEADRMANLSFTPEQLQSERRVVLEERRSRTDNIPSARLREQTRAVFFLNHPYRLPVIGWEHEIRTLDHADVHDFYRRWYTPANAILVVAGPVTLDQVKALAEETYGRVPARAPPERIAWAEPPRAGPTRLTMRDQQVRQPYWSRAYLAPSVNVGERRHTAALEVLSEILAGGPSARLRRVLIDEGDLAVSIGASYDAYQRGPASFNVFATPKDAAGVAAVEAAMDGEIRRLLADGVTDAEVARARQRLLDSAVYARDGIAGPARIVGGTLAIGLALDDIDAWPERIARVDAAAVLEAARAVFAIDQSVTAILLPEGTS